VSQRSAFVLAAVAVIPLLGACSATRRVGKAIEPGDHLAEVNGARLRYHVRGSGPPVLVHPGGPGCTSAYVRMPALESHFTLVYLDPVGTGESSRLSRGEYTLERYAADLDALRAALGLEKAWVLGHSYGGVVALVWAASRPDRVRGLLLVDTTARIDEEWTKDLEAHMQARSGEPWYADAMEGMAAMEAAKDDASFTAALRRIVPFGFADYTHRRAEFDAVIGRFDCTLEPNLPPPLGPDAPFDLRPRLSGIRAPTLILVGRNDYNCGPTYAEEIRRGIAGAQVVTFERSGHMPYMEETEAFVDAIRRFVAQNP
jgi:proline iminopeptidase